MRDDHSFLQSIGKSHSTLRTTPCISEIVENTKSLEIAIGVMAVLLDHYLNTKKTGLLKTGLNTGINKRPYIDTSWFFST